MNNYFFSSYVVLLASLFFLSNISYWRRRKFSLRAYDYFFLFLEILSAYFLFIVIGRFLEYLEGVAYQAQTWIFYSATITIFLVLGFPGFVFLFLLRNRVYGQD